jgi:hypothetical protein
MVRRLRCLWSTLVDGDRLDRELEDELESSVTIIADRLMRSGLDAEAARVAAERTFLGPGGLEPLREAVRLTRPGSMLQSLQCKVLRRGGVREPTKTGSDRRAAGLLVLLTCVLAASSAHTASPRAKLIEARNLAYDANYRNDQQGLRSAIGILAPLAAAGDVNAYRHYYLSWTYWALANSQLEEPDVPGALESARRAAEYARLGLAQRSDDPEFHVVLVNALIVIGTVDASAREPMTVEFSTARRRALELGPTNPRVVMMDAGVIFYAPAARGGSRERGLARWEEALRLFEAEMQVSSADPIAPRWGYALACGWMPFLHLRMDPPQKQQARAAADMALSLRPDFWYVHARVLPRLRE